MTAKYGNSLSFKRLARFLLVLILLVSLLQFLPGAISGVNNRASAASDPVIAAAGDIACDPGSSNFNGGNGTSNACRELYTSNLLLNTGLTAVLDLGDNQYYCGSDQAFLQSYDVSWGRVKAMTHPSVGNHEYLTSGGTGCNTSNANAAGYFQYFGSAAGTPGQGWYSFDIGSWHLIALNTNCGNAGGCSSGSPQYKWLQADLAAHPNQCILAYWHIPLFSSGGRASSNSKSFWNLLYAAHADVNLTGHDHTYERFDLQNPSGVADPNGIREFVVGTGGNNHTSFTTIFANSQVRNNTTFGVLRMTLHSSSYDWQFVPEAGKTFTDSGTTACHSAGLATATPTPTLAQTNTPTITNTPTLTQAASNTPTATPTLANTATFTPAASNTPTNTPTFTNTPAITNTPTFTFTPTNTPLATNTPTLTFTPTNTPLATNTPTLTFTPTNTPLATNTPTATSSGGQTFTFTPIADAYVDSSQPASNFGTGTTIRVDGSPIVNSYIKFSVSGLSGTVTKVSLMIFANSSGSLGIKANSVADTSWGETSLTYNTAPPLGSVLASSAAFTSGTWVTLDVTGYITADGTYSFGITDPSSTAISLASRESGANAEKLIIITQ